MDSNCIAPKQDLTTLSSRQPIALVCAADDKYAMPLAATARSALENLGDNYELILFVIDGGISKSNRNRIVKSLNTGRCNVKFVQNPNSLLSDIQVLRSFNAEGVTEHKYITVSAYYRLLITELLPEHFEKAIYLDCDVIVKNDLSQLWEIDLGDKYLFAAQEMWTPYVSSPTGLINYKELGLSPNSKYFNSGVLVINLKKWRADSISSKAVDYLRHKRECVRSHDQDVLNALLANHWGELDPRWNVTPGIYTYSSWQESPFSESVYNSVIHEPYIIHYASDAKPWNARIVSLKDDFFYYLDKTAWSGWRLTFWRRLRRRLVREFRQLINRA